MILYFVKLSSKDQSEEFFKVGVTSTDVKSRFAYGSEKIIDSSSLSLREKVERRMSGQEYISDMPYEVTEIHTVSYQLDGDALIAESELLKALQKNRYWPKQQFSGRSECFVGDEIEENIIEFMDRDSGKKNKNAPSALKYKLAESQVKRKYSDPIDKHRAVLEKCNQLWST